ncbi:MAG: DUF3616 domain-containing protein [Acidobacteriota bacterium]
MKENDNDKMSTIEAEYRVIEEEKDARQPLTPPTKSSVPALIVVVLLAAIGVTAGIAYYLMRGDSNNHTNKNSSASNTQSAGQQSGQTQGGQQTSQTQTQTPPVNAGIGVPFLGQKFEASGVVHLPGTDTVVFVDDSREFEVFMMQINDAGQQVGAVRSVRLGAGIEDLEGITYDGTYFYVVGSQSEPEKGAANAIARFTMDQNSLAVSNLSVIPNFRSLLLSRVAEFRGTSHLEGDDGGLNIEGIAWDPEGKRLMLGLRSPILNGQALILPVGLRDAGGPFTADNLQLDARPIPLFLEQSGIRDIQYDSRLKSFLLISGAPENVRRGIFAVWEWDGRSSQPRQRALLDSRMKPEGITQAKVGDRDFIFIVCDENRYVRLDY